MREIGKRKKRSNAAREEEAYMSAREFALALTGTSLRDLIILQMMLEVILLAPKIHISMTLGSHMNCAHGSSAAC